VNQISGTTPADAPAEAQHDSRPADTSTESPGFAARGRMRRRARFLHRARELAYRDLGGLVFNLHRFGQRNDGLVMTKLTTLGHIDAELRALEDGLQERHPVTVLREAGITACARCAAIHSSEDKFCPNCGLSLGAHADLPIAGAASSPPAPMPAAATGFTQPFTAPEATPPTATHPAAAPPAEPATAISGAPPAPARADEPESPARPEPAPPAGRSPTPRRPPPASASPSQAPHGEDEPTEILHPQSPGT
jgi:hypothetical protein